MELEAPGLLNQAHLEDAMHLVLENMAATETVYCAEKVGYLIVVTTVPVEQPEDHGRSSRHKVLGTISHKIPV